ncbi:unnamed protein product [Linum trigynum]|uniref:Secreted protein n=1 Tax=Linum trigynum TaxID=586398 RepID=A0AAV2DT67_9ROSI
MRPPHHHLLLLVITPATAEAIFLAALTNRKLASMRNPSPMELQRKLASRHTDAEPYLSTVIPYFWIGGQMSLQ